jgi:single-strand DNA-binding protein
MSLNKALIIGNLTRDPELRQIPSGVQVCTFGVATNRQWKDQDGALKEQVEYHNVVAWRRLAEICSQYLTKGRKVFVEGHLQTRDWEGQDGVRRYRTEVIADNMIILDRPGQASGGHLTQAAAPAPEEGGGSVQPPDVFGINPEEEIKVEDIPF